MPRTARIAFENGFFHVYNRSKENEVLFKHEKDYKRFLETLQKLSKSQFYDHSLLAYVLLPNYFHLIIQTRSISLAKIVSSLLTSYSMYYNLKYKHKGSVFHDRFKSKTADAKIYYKRVTRYFYLLPVKEGITEDYKSYLWSSYYEIVNQSDFNTLDKEQALRLIGDTPFQREKYDKYLNEGIPIINDIASHYNFSKQVEADPEYNLLVKKQYTRERIKRKIEGWFRLR